MRSHDVLRSQSLSFLHNQIRFSYNLLLCYLAKGFRKFSNKRKPLGAEAEQVGDLPYEFTLIYDFTNGTFTVSEKPRLISEQAN